MVRSLLILLFCFLVGRQTSALTDSEFVVPESGRPPASSSPKDFNTELEITAGAQTLGGGDVSDTYGLLPFGGVGLSWQLSARTRLVLSARYCQTEGDPYYDTPEFQADQPARLRSVPVVFAVRENLVPGGRTRFLGGAGLEIAWVEETLPTGTDSRGRDTKSGYGVGLVLTLGPEWRTRDERRAVGVEFALGGCGADLGPGRGSHDVDLTGFHARAYVTMQLSGGAQTEVQP